MLEAWHDAECLFNICTAHSKHPLRGNTLLSDNRETGELFNTLLK